MTNDEGILKKFFALGNSYWLTRFVILRLLGFVYAVAFLVAAQQLVPLIGEHGLTPANHFLASVQTQLGSRTAGVLRVPSLFWFGISDHGMVVFAWTGFALSLVVFAGYANAIILGILWAMYMSIVGLRASFWTRACKTANRLARMRAFVPLARSFAKLPSV